MSEITDFYDMLSKLRTSSNFLSHIEDKHYYQMNSGYAIHLLAPDVPNWPFIKEVLGTQMFRLNSIKNERLTHTRKSVIRNKESETIIENVLNSQDVQLFFPVFRNIIKRYIRNVTLGGQVPDVLRKGSVLDVGVRAILKSLNAIEESADPKVTLYVTKDLKSGRTFLVYNPMVVLRMIIEDFMANGFRFKDPETNLYDILFFFIAHECNHILYGHVSDATEYDAIFGRRLAGISMDAYINSRLREELGMHTVDSGIDGGMYCHVYRGVAMAEYFGTKVVPNGPTPMLYLVFANGWKANIFSEKAPDRESDILYFISSYKSGMGAKNTYSFMSHKPEPSYLGCFLYEFDPSDTEFSLFYNYLYTFLFERKVLSATEEMKQALKDQIKDLQKKLDDKKSKQPPAPKPDDITPSNPSPTDKTDQGTDDTNPDQPQDDNTSDDKGKSSKPQSGPFKVGDIVTIKSTGELAKVKGITIKDDGSFDITLVKVEES